MKEKKRSKIKILLGASARMICTPENYADLVMKVEELMETHCAKGLKCYYMDPDQDVIVVDREEDYQNFLGSEFRKLKLAVSDSTENAFKLLQSSIQINSELDKETSEKIVGPIPKPQCSVPVLNPRPSREELVNWYSSSIIARLKEELEKMPESELKSRMSEIEESQRVEKAPMPVPRLNSLPVQCAGCKVNPIVGALYQCSVCSNLFLCEKCEEKYGHEHSLFKTRGVTQPSCCASELKVEFLSDLEYTTTVVLSSSDCSLKWILKNTGKHAFPSDTYLMQLEGGIKCQPLLVGELKSSETKDYELEFRAPQLPNKYQLVFQLQSLSMGKFGRPCIILVLVKYTLPASRPQSGLADYDIPPAMMDNMRMLSEKFPAMEPSILLSFLSDTQNNLQQAIKAIVGRK